LFQFLTALVNETKAVAEVLRYVGGKISPEMENPKVWMVSFSSIMSHQHRSHLRTCYGRCCGWRRTWKIHGIAYITSSTWRTICASVQPKTLLVHCALWFARFFENIPSSISILSNWRLFGWILVVGIPGPFAKRRERRPSEWVEGRFLQENRSWRLCRWRI